MTRRWNFMGSVVLGMLASTSLVACGASATPDDERGQPDNTPSAPVEEASSLDASERVTGGSGSERPLHTLQIGDATITFSAVTPRDSQAIPTIHESSSRLAPRVVDTLLEAEGNLTFLEIFLALADPQAEPDPVLVESHPAEAAALGRTDASVREVGFDPGLLDKVVSPATCDSLAYTTGSRWIYKAKRDYASGFTYNCINNDCGLWTNLGTKCTVCGTTGEVGVELRAAFDVGSGWDGQWQPVPQNYPGTHYMASGTWRRYSCDGNSSNGLQYHSRVGAAYVKGAH